MEIAESLRRMPLLPSLVRNVRILRSRIIDAQLDISTVIDDDRPLADSSHFNDHFLYDPMDYRCIPRVLNRLGLNRNDVLYDIGCGLGRVLCVASRMGAAKCVGIELFERFAAQARRNAASLRGATAPIEIRTQDAALADYSDGTAFWLFNPFGGQTLRAVLQRIRESLARNPRPIRIVYAKPNHDGQLRACRWLRQYDAMRFRTFHYPIQFWESGSHRGRPSSRPRRARPGRSQSAALGHTHHDAPTSL